MSHIALYRKFRPILFSDIVGQEHITKTIKNQIKNNRVGHAYLFSGGRGTGKTTAAKILARSINCLNPIDGEPCNKCETCTDILFGKNTDVVEMDAASNNGVDDIRQIIEKVNFLPTSSKYRVYIIDEVHMLSQGAFNALLKTLEEPPVHVIFILATTEPQKLPATILSRCQKFDFRKIDTKNIVKRLEIISKESNLNINKEALETIAILGEGSARDSISILETCIAEEKEVIDKEKVKEIVGIPPIEYSYLLINAITEYDSISALNTLEEVLKNGKDLSNYIFEIIKYLKDILIFQVTKSLEIYSVEEIKQIEELANKVFKERLLELINIFINLENSIKNSNQQLILVQSAIIKASSKFNDESILGLEERIKKLEQMLTTGKITTSKAEIPREIIRETKDILQEKPINQEEVVQRTSAIKEAIVEENDSGEYASYWKNVLDGLKQNGKVILYTNLIKTRAKEDGDTLLIEFMGGISSFGKIVIEKEDNKQELIKMVSKIKGKEMKIKYVEKEENTVNKENNINIIENLDIPINIIEE